MSLRNRMMYSLMYLLPGHPAWDTGISPPELVSFIKGHPPGKALDLGCGTGTNAITLAQHGWQVNGIDFAGRAIRLAKRKAKISGLNIDFRVDSVSSPRNLAGPFDLVLDIGCFHSLTAEERKQYARNLAGWLAPQGFFLTYVFFRGLSEKGPGLVEADLRLLGNHLIHVARQDGSERGIRPSAWLLYQARRE